MILEIDNIELKFKNKSILNGIYLKAEQGKATAILGRNGCGKTCLLQIILGTLKPKYKLLRIDNTPVLKPLYKTGFVGFLPQHNFIPKFLTVSQIFSLYKVSWKGFISDFETFERYRNFTIGRLSGGEKRIIEAYLIIKSDFKLILLDEPFSHIEPLHIEKIKSLIIVEKHRKSIIITDHMFEHVLDIADDIYLLKDGYSKLIKEVGELEAYKYLSVGKLGD